MSQATGPRGAGPSGDGTTPSSRRPPTRLAGAALLIALILAALVVAESTQALRTPSGEALGPANTDPTVACHQVATSQLPLRVTSTQLLACPNTFDGLPVVLVGEVVGDLLGRGRRRWIQLNDDPYAFLGPLDVHHQALGTSSGIAVLLPEGEQPRVLGGPGVWGDRIEVSGAFLAAAPQDQGGAAVVARKVRLLTAGSVVETPADPRLLVAAALMLLLAALVWLDVLRRHRQDT